MADEHAYRVTYKSGRVAICNRRSLAGKIGMLRGEQRSQREWGYRVWPNHDIVKVERSPLVYTWANVTAEFLGFDPECPACDLDIHRCPGCGEPVPHGTVACEACHAL